jgi:hypothetical protein
MLAASTSQTNILDKLKEEPKRGGVRFGLFWEIWKTKRSNLKGKKQKLNFSPKD